MSERTRVRRLRRDELGDAARAAYLQFLATTLLTPVVDPDTSLPTLAGVLLHNPGVYRGNSGSSELILKNCGIPARDREIVTLRVAWLCRAPVAWANHVGHAHTLGMSESEVGAVAAGPDAPGWSPVEWALLRLVDELHASASVSDECWATLAAHYDTAQLVALPMLIGLYHQVCFTFNTLGVPEADPSLGGLDYR